MDYRARYFLLLLPLLLGCEPRVSFEGLEPEMNRALALMEREPSLQALSERAGGESYYVLYGNGPPFIIDGTSIKRIYGTRFSESMGDVDSVLAEAGLDPEVYHELAAVIESSVLKAVEKDHGFGATRFVTHGRRIVDEFGFAHFADESRGDSLQQEGLSSFRLERVKEGWYRYEYYY